MQVEILPSDGALARIVSKFYDEFAASRYCYFKLTFQDVRERQMKLASFVARAQQITDDVKCM